MPGACAARSVATATLSAVSVRVRFAPSPTGPLHLGSAMTAVANYLFAHRARRGVRAARRRHRRGAQRAPLRALGAPGRRVARPALRRGAGHRRRATAPTGRASAATSTRASPRAARERRRVPLLLLGVGARACASCRGGGRAPVPLRPALRVAHDRRGGAGAPGRASRSPLRLRAPAGAIEIADAARGKVVIPDGAIDDLVLLRSDGTRDVQLRDGRGRRRDGHHARDRGRGPHREHGVAARDPARARPARAALRALRAAARRARTEALEALGAPSRSPTCAPTAIRPRRSSTTSPCSSARRPRASTRSPR